MPISARTALLVAFLISAVVAPPSSDSKSRAVPVCVLAKDLVWRENPHVHGLRTSTLAGDPSAAGPYAQRIRFPANYRLPPHFHPNNARMVTVLSGTLYFAYGSRFDETRLAALPPGSFFTEPRNMPHYALTRNEPVVLQLNAMGPDGTKYVEGTAKRD